MSAPQLHGSAMQKHPPPNGIPPEPPGFAEYIREVEAFIAGEDPETKLLHKIERKLKRRGLAALGKPERVVYAVSRFQGAMMNGCLELFFTDTPPQLQKVVAEGFDLLYGDDKSALFVDIRRRYLAGQITDFTDEEGEIAVGPFVECYLETFERLDAYAKEKGLL